MKQLDSVVIYLYCKLDGHQSGAPGLWKTLYEQHTSWPECVTNKADDNIIKFLLLVFKKDFVVYDTTDSIKRFLVLT